jgi:uncharacterized protein
MASVLVRGSASSAVEPDFAVVSLGLSHLAADPGAALDEVSARSRQLEAVLETLAIERADWVTDGVSLAEEWRYVNDANTLAGYRANAGVTVTVRRLGQVADVIGQGVTSCAASVRSLTWHVRDDNAAHRDLLRRAAEDARRRAETYTEALGTTLGPVELISDLPPGEPPGGGAVFARAKMADHQEMAVGEGRVQLSAEVYVRFGVMPGH